MKEKPKGRPPISDAEWRVMNLLWEGSPRTSQEVIAALTEVTDWHPKTVQTLLGRLVKKGYLAYEVDGQRYRYEPAVARRDCVTKEGRSFLDRVFAGDAASMLLHFARDAELSPRQAEELRKILDRSDRETGKDKEA